MSHETSDAIKSQARGSLVGSGQMPTGDAESLLAKRSGHEGFAALKPTVSVPVVSATENFAGTPTESALR